LLIISLSCPKEPTEPEPEPETIIAENVVVIEEGGQVILEGVDSTAYHYSFTGTPPDIQTGDVIVGTDDLGYLRKVTSATIEGNSMTIFTDSAALTDAIVRGSMQTNIQLNLENALGLGGQSEVKIIYLAEGAKITQDGLDFSGLSLSLLDSVSNVIGTMVFTNGYFNFESDLDIGFEIENARIEEFHAIASGEVDVNIDIDITFNGITAHGDTILATFQFPAIIVWVGTVPVVIVPTLEVIAGYNFHAGTLTFYTGFDVSASIEFGARYENSEWTTIWNRNLSASGHETGCSFHLDMSTKAFVGPQLSFTIYGVAGPTLMADPFLRLDGNINLEEWYLGLSRGIEGYLGFQVRILSWLLVSYYTPLFAEESVLWDTSGQIQQNHPPDPPLNPSPANGNDDVPVTILLEWDCSDPDGDPLLYDVYFGTDPTPDEGELVSENQSQEYYNPPGNLDYGTTYYWQIMAEDDEFETEGPIWNFTTTGQGNQPPNPPSNPNPPNNSTGQPININVSWTCTDPDGDPLNFDVYFGTMSPPPLVSLNQSQTTYDPGQLENSTIYYWRIVAIDNQQDSTGSPQWNFTTTDDTSLFSSPIGYATGTSPNGISSADFDGDGDNDIAVACYSSDAVSILLNI
jgi:hypothetical protein